MDTSGETIGQRIRKVRRSRSMTQDELARAVGVSRSAVAQWETSRSGQVSGNLTRIAESLGVSVGYLVAGEPEQGGTTAETGTELALLRIYRQCSDDDRALLLRTALRLVRTPAR